MKSVILAAFLLFSAQTFAAEKETVTNEELQEELNAMSEDIVLDQEDEDFLATEQELQKEEAKGKVVWGKVAEPVKKAQAPAAKPATKKQ